MARIGAAPETHYTLPAEFAAELGQCVASFGWLEEIIKRTIFALDRAQLADDLTQHELEDWFARMTQVAGDSLGTLIEQLDAAMARHKELRDRSAITRRLAEIRNHRNALCHASWRPTMDKWRWHPAFVSNRGEVARQPVDMEGLRRIRSETIEIGSHVLRVMRATGIHGYWAGDDEV